jgi:hypothetical protein
MHLLKLKRSCTGTDIIEEFLPTSCRVRSEGNIAKVVMRAPYFITPRMIVQRCIPSNITATPFGSILEADPRFDGVIRS